MKPHAMAKATPHVRNVQRLYRSIVSENPDPPLVTRFKNGSTVNVFQQVPG